MDSELSNQAILRELELVLSSPEFLRNERQSRFLRFIVERKLEGRLNELKESVIATEVFGRAPDYDPKLDAVVRTEATRLRARLSRYYTSDGVQDPIEIDLPKGGYKPVFKTRILKNSHRRFPRLFPSSSWPLVAVVSILAIVVLGAISLRRAKPAETRPVAFAVDVPPGVQLGHNSPQRGIGTAAPHFAPSPDGRSLAYVAFSGDSKPLLWVRRLDAVGGQPLTGTEDAAFPFWSPDGRFVAFFAEGKLKAIEASGGSVYTICDAPGGQGGTWNRDGDIIFAPSGRSGLFKVSRTGGTASPVTALDPNQLEVSHRWPQFLPDGRHFLYLAVAGPMGGFLVSAGALETRRALYVGSIDSSQRTLLLKGVMRSAYSAGHLLFLRDKTLIAQEFDAGSLQLSGKEIPVAEHVSINPGNGLAGFAVSESGVLMYRRETMQGKRQLAWVDRQGHQLRNMERPGEYGRFYLSPDNGKLAVYLRDDDAGFSGDLTVFSIEPSGLSSALKLVSPETEAGFAWSPDGSRIAYVFGRDNTELYQRDIANIDDAQLVVASSEPKEAGTWSPNGRYLAFTQADRKTGRDIWIAPLFGDRKPVPFLRTNANEHSPAFSPDGHWIAYISDKAGGGGLYIKEFPSGVREWTIATDNSTWPSWRADGRELFYVSRGNLMSVAVRLADSPEFAAPVKLFAAPISPGRYGEYAVSADGQRFLMIEQQDTAASAAAVPLTVIVNWPAKLTN